MSTKIYDAYVLKDPSRIWDYLRTLRRRVEHRATQQLDRLADQLHCEVQEDSLEFQRRKSSQHYCCNWDVRESLVWRRIREEYHAAYQHPYSSPFDLDVTLAVHEHKGNFYLVGAEGDGMRGVLTDTLARSRLIADFHFQNSTDRPPHISAKEWSHRKRTWEAICGRFKNLFKGCLLAKFVSIDSWQHVQPRDARLELHCKRYGHKRMRP